MALENQVLIVVVPNQEQGAIGNEEQYCTNISYHAAEGTQGKQTHQSEKIHGAVSQKVHIHGGHHHFGGGFPYSPDNHQGNAVVQNSHQDHEKDGNLSKIDRGRVYGDEEKMAEQEADATHGKPFMALGNQKDVTQPAGQQRQHQRPGKVLGRYSVVSR